MQKMRRNPRLAVSCLPRSPHIDTSYWRCSRLTIAAVLAHAHVVLWTCAARYQSLISNCRRTTSRMHEIQVMSQENDVPSEISEDGTSNAPGSVSEMVAVPTHYSYATFFHRHRGALCEAEEVFNTPSIYRVVGLNKITLNAQKGLPPAKKERKQIGPAITRTPTYAGAILTAVASHL